MSTVLSQPEGPDETERRRQGVPWPPDTTAGSVLHRFANYSATAPTFPSIARIYFASIAITYVPLLLAAVFSGLPLWTTAPKFSDISLPFLRDWNIAFAFLISFPALVVLLVTDDHVLFTSLRHVLKHRVISIPEAGLVEVSNWCKTWFRMINIGAQSLGVGIGLVFGCATLNMYFSHPVGFWIVSNHHLLRVGYVYLYCIVLLYALITIYVLRCIAISVFLNKVVAHATIHMLPFHPDMCGGLSPVGQLGLRNQYTLSILGLNIVILAWVSISKLLNSPSLHHLIAASVVAYLILGPIVFMVPLLPFRKGMLQTKDEWMSDVAQRLRNDFERLRAQIQTSQITKEDEDLVDRLRKIGSVIGELPVWPFDARTLRQFARAYVVPLVPLGFPQVGKALTATVRWLIGQ